MSKKDSAIRSIINHFLSSKEPLYTHAYMWRNYDNQSAVHWLSNKKFVKYRKEGEYYKVTRSKTFYDIYEEIKDMGVNEIMHYLKDKFKVVPKVVNICPNCGSTNLKFPDDSYSYSCKDCGYQSPVYETRGQRKKAMIKRENKDE